MTSPEETARPGRVPPLWRAAPARLWRSPGWFWTLTAATALLVAAVVSIPVFERSVDAGAFAAEVGAVDPDDVGRDGARVRVIVPGVLAGQWDERARTLLDDVPVLEPPVVSTFGAAERLSPRAVTSWARAGDAQVRATLHHRDGAVERLASALGTTARPGAWLAEDVAAELGVDVGDRLTVAVELRVGGTVTNLAPPPDDGAAPDPDAGTVELVGLFPTREDSVLPAVVDEDVVVATPRDLPTAGDGRGRSALLLVDRGTFDRLALEVGEQPMWVADLRLPPEPGPPQMRAAAAAVTELARAAFQEGGALQVISAAALPEGTDAQLATGLREIVERAEVTAGIARAQVRSTAWAGVALGVLAVVGGAVLLHAGRRHEHVLAAGLGLRPAAVLGLATLEALPALLLGTVVAAAVTPFLVGRIGPSPRLGDGVLEEVAAWAAAALTVALLAVGLAAAVTAAALTRATGPGLGPRTRGLPWPLLAGTAAVVSGIALGGTDAARSPGILAVAFPVLVATTVAGVLLAVVRRPGVLRRPARRTRPAPTTALPTTASPTTAPRGVGWLAARRLQRSPREATATVVVVAVGASLALWAVAADRGVERGVVDKVAVLAGAQTRADLAGPWEVADLGEPLPDEAPDLLTDPDAAELLLPPTSLLAGSTLVYRAGVAVPPRFGQIDLLAVDAATFADHALWGATDALAPGRDALWLLVDGPVQEDVPTGRATSSPELPVVLVGRGWDAGSGTVDAAGEWAFRFEAVARVPVFPGVTGRAVVVDARSLLSVLPPISHPSVRRIQPSPPNLLRTELWSPREVSEVETFLAAREAAAPVSAARTLAEQTPGLRGASWPLDYLVALGACAGLLGVVAMVLHAVRAADRDRLGELMLRRMGLSPSRLVEARAREAAGVLALAGLAAVLTVIGIGVLGPPLVDPAPRLAPLVRPALTGVDLGLLVVALAVTTALVTVVARRRAGAVSAGEVLRGED